MEPASESFFDFSLFGWPWTGLVTLFTLFIYYVLAFRVGKARARHGVPAPSMEGPVEFQKAMRIQINTMEQLVVFLPLLWMAALSSRDELAAAIGIFWPISRIMYAIGYSSPEPKKRHAGFIFGVVVLVALFAIVGVQLIHSLMFFAQEQPPIPAAVP